MEKTEITIAKNNYKPIFVYDEMSSSYLSYAMSVIVSRALPDVRDGLKPVHRRIIYAMYKGGFDWSKQYRKSARIVGDVIGKYHPHGDQAVYDALVRLTQNFSMSLPLIDGQGNFGSIDGDPPAAMRYTETKLAKVSQYLINDIEKKVIDFRNNYDESEKEPSVLPSQFPNLLVNGAGGIAVGMATSIPPHNLGEIIDGTIAYINNRDISISQLMKKIPGPDFPTGGIIIGKDNLKQGYNKGRGSIKIRGEIEVENLKNGKERLVIKSIPYQINKSVLNERIAELARDKKIKEFDDFLSNCIIKNFNFSLTNDQTKIIKEINDDLKSDFKMFRLLQGDVGSGKTIVSFIAAANVISSNWQVALMAPTEILAKQHYNLAIKTFNSTDVNIKFLTGKSDIKEKKLIRKNLLNGKINFLIGTHALFQKNILFKNLGLIIIDEQHKFGVKQRIELSNKGGKDCDILLMSATPIPRTLVLAVYGDMDVSRLIEKPTYRKDIITLSKPEEKIDEILTFIKKQIKNGNQVFWVCPLIEESKKLDYSAAVKKYNRLSKIFYKKVGLIHGGLKSDEKNKVLNNFLKRSIDILVSTTVIEVGIDFPNANVIIIENSNKFGLSQLHQLRGRVGRGAAQGTCILLYKKNLSENAKKRIRILKSSNNGFFIAEKDMKLRGFGDVMGYQQSGIKDFKLADPIHHEDLFKIAEENIKDIEYDENNFKKYTFLLKLFDKADIVNLINLEKAI